MSEFEDGPLCYAAMVTNKPARDTKGSVCVYLQHKGKEHISALIVDKDDRHADALMKLKKGDEVFVPYSFEMIASVVYNNPFKRLWNRLFW